MPHLIFYPLTFILGLMAGGHVVLYWLRPSSRSTLTRQDIDRLTGGRP